MSCDLQSLPKHVAFIMDGNGRWAKARGKNRSFGHRAGVESLRNIIQYCGDLGIDYVTVYAFSTENFKRSNEEVSTLMSLLSEFLKKDIDRIIQNGVRINIIGDIGLFSKPLQKEINYAMQKSKACTKMVLNIALAYGSRNEITNAMKQIAEKISAGELNVDDISEDLISQYLYTEGQPDPDLIIRTSGEMRLSNFLLYQAAYSELYFSTVMWPDFTPEEFDKALLEFNNRERRFGGA
jgi:undecaprenyl diphosphate synthase